MNTARRWGLASFLKTNNDPDLFGLKLTNPIMYISYIRVENSCDLKWTINCKLQTRIVSECRLYLQLYHKCIQEAKEDPRLNIRGSYYNILKSKKRTPSKAFLTLNYHLHSAPSPHPPASSIIQYFTKRIVNIRKLLFSRALGISPAWKEVIAWHSVKNIWDILTSLFMTVLKSEIGQ